MGQESCTPRTSKRNYSLSIFELQDETVLFILYRSHIRQMMNRIPPPLYSFRGLPRDNVNVITKIRFFSIYFHRWQDFTLT